MITESQIYWITRLDALRGLCVVLMVVCLLGAVASFIFHCAGQGDALPAQTLRAIKRWLAIFGICAIFPTLGLIFIPTTKEMMMIKIIPIIANSKVVSEDLPKDVREIYDMAKKELINKLNDEKGKK